MSVVINNKHIDFDVVVLLMDDEIREKLHSQLSPCSEQTFVDSYFSEHCEQYGEEFVVN